MTNEQLIKDLNDRIDNQLICRKEVMGTVQRIVERIHMDVNQDFEIWQGRCDMDDLEALLSHARQVVRMDTMIHVLKSVEITIKESL